jgi:hypothetical protein
MLYIIFTVLIGIISLVIPYMQKNMFIILMPTFCITVFLHMLMTVGKKQGIVVFCFGAGTILLYPFAVVFDYLHLDAVVACLFILFCVWPALVGTYGYVKLTVMTLLSLSSLSGIIVYEIYPRSIHGMHAAFLSMAILAGLSLFFMPHYEYRLVGKLR